MGHETSDGLKWSLRVLAGFSGVIGVGFIIWACVVQNPPKSALPMYVPTLLLHNEHDILTSCTTQIIYFAVD